MIRDLVAADWPAVRAIYEEGIATGHATFQPEAPAWEQGDAGHLASCRLVFVRGEDVVGWAALSPVSGRAVYAGVSEVSVYVAARARGAGVGRALLTRLVADSEQHGIWTLQAGVFPENAASLAVHARCGFRIVGRREKLGAMNGQWRDVLLLERRSGTVGVAASAPASGSGTLFHITTADEARAASLAGSYSPQGFAAEGFIHCSYAHQVRGVANRIFSGRRDLVLFQIDRARVPHRIVDENLEGGRELFPHIYGRLGMDAVVRVHAFPCGGDGRFELPLTVDGKPP